MNQPCGRRGFASGGFNPSTSGINQEKRDVSIFQRFLGNRDGSVQSNGNPRGSGRGGRGGYRGGRGGGFNSFATGGNQERHDNDSNNRGRGGYRGGRGGGFNSSTSGGNQERREGSIFQRFLGSSNGTSNPFTSGSNQENNGRDSNRDGRGGYRGGRGGGFNPFATGGIQDRHEPAQNGFAANRGGTFNQFNSGNDQDRHGYDSNNPGRGGYRGGRGGGFNAFATGANQEIVGHTSNRDDFAQLNGNPRGSYRGGRGAYRGQRRISGHQNQADGNQNVDDNILDNNVYVPHNRISEELFAEDQKAEALYANVVDDDEDVVVENFDQSLFRLMKWEDAEFEQQLLTNVKERAKHIRPRKIQSVTIPLVIDRFDVICQAETGSGKTAAYLLSIIDDIMKGKLCKDDDTFVSEAASPFAIIIVPTRELAQQIYEQAVKFADKTGVSIAKAYGKYHLGPNNNEIRFGCDVLVGTPGRLMHFIKSGEVRVKKLRTFVLDEADRLCDDEFVKDILEIVNIPGFPEVKKRQTLFFSATFPPEVISMKENIMVSEAVFVKNLHMLPNKRIKQDFILVNAQSKLDLLADLLLAEAEKAGGVEEMRRTLVFVNTKQMSDMAALFLCQRGIRALSINDDRPQHIREQALAEFRSRKVPVLCATDVIERGIDIKELDHVINMDLPINAMTYIHRIGRTGRITRGYATTFFAGNEPLLFEIAKMLRENNEEVPETLRAAIAD